MGKLFNNKMLVNQLIYFNSTDPPASSSWTFSSSASAFETLSLIAFGAPSTNSLASFKPRLVIVLTALITFILDEPD